jgi:hypothetical protein
VRFPKTIGTSTEPSGDSDASVRFNSGAYVRL